MVSSDKVIKTLIMKPITYLIILLVGQLTFTNAITAQSSETVQFKASKLSKIFNKRGFSSTVQADLLEKLDLKESAIIEVEMIEWLSLSADLTHFPSIEMTSAEIPALIKVVYQNKDGVKKHKFLKCLYTISKYRSMRWNRMTCSIESLINENNPQEFQPLLVRNAY